MPDAVPPDDKLRQPTEAALGGADAVEKTTYVTGSGTEPERVRTEGAPAAKGGASRAPNATTAILIFLAVGAVLVYLFGWGR